ncbi:MAG: transglutaminase-like domain-containing protein [Treponema sp.]|nr:transglutaminase-like domain-containing protein [Treponema sp.]
MKKKLAVLFSMRLFFWFSVVSIPFFHPGISVSYDRAGLLQWFLIVPFEALAAFLPVRGKGIVRFFLAVPPLLLFSVLAGGFGPGALVPLCTGLLSFTLTFLLFHYPRWGKLSVAEPFLLAWICFRLLVFSRSGEEAAGESMGLTQIILVATAAAFLLHSLVVYFCLYPRGVSGSWGETAILALGFAAALAAVFILPADFVRNQVIANLLPDRARELSKPDDNDWGIPDNARGGGRRTIPGDESGRQPDLRGLSEYDWPGGQGKGKGKGKERGSSRGKGEGGEERQYTVMVVASKREPLYMGDSFRGRLDPLRGFLPSQDEPLNSLPLTRLFNTWFDTAPGGDMGREQAEVFSLSMLPQNFLPYRPFALEPTVLSEGSGPLRYMHRVFSRIHSGDPLNLLFVPVRDLSGAERELLAPYLEVPLEEGDREIFAGFLEDALDTWDERSAAAGSDTYMEKILAILTGFEDYQYTINDNDDYSIAALREFLLDTKDGDCVEFSNTAALLGRLAGIPSRVVTGYLAAESLQTRAHRRGLAALQSRIKVLQDYSPADLYLVTDAHAHSWPQFYIPGYGWIDFESTQFAIPPFGMGDGNMRDVVIPLIDETKVFSQVRAFPWRAVLRTAALLALASLLCAYAVRYGRELFLFAGSRGGGRAGSRSLYLLLLARLAADGRPIKPAAKTAAEYSRLFPAAIAPGGLPGGPSSASPFEAFAALYTELRWREFPDEAEQAERFGELKREYRKIIKITRRRGIPAFFIRIFSLRGLAYL